MSFRICRVKCPFGCAKNPIVRYRAFLPVPKLASASHALVGVRYTINGKKASDPQQTSRRSSSTSSVAAAYAALSRSDFHHLSSLAVAGAMLNLGYGVVVPVLPSLAAEFGLGASGVGVILAMPNIVRVSTNVLFGRLADRIGRKPLMVGGQVIAGVGVAATGLAPNFAALLPARLLVGAGSAAAAAGTAAYLADLTNVPQNLPHRGVILGVTGALASVAWIAGPAIGGLLAEAYGARFAFVAVSGVISGCGAAYMFLPETLGTLAKKESANLDLSLYAQYIESRELLACPKQVGVVACTTALFLNYSAMITVLPLAAQMVWGAGPGDIGLLFSAVSCLGLLGGPIAGALSDRYGREALLAPGLFIQAVGAASMGFAPDFWSFTACAFVWGTGQSIVSPALTAYAQDAAPDEQRGQALALSRQASDGTFLVAPLALGFLAEYCGNCSALAATGMLTAMSVLLLPRRGKTTL